MKTQKKLAASFGMLILFLIMMVSPVYAAKVSQDGIDVTLTTDKEEYVRGEEIAVTLKVTNQNEVAVKNVSLENLIPEGYELADGSQAIKQVQSLDAGETVVLQVKYVSKDTTENDNNEPSNDGEASGTVKPENTNNNVGGNNGNKPSDFVVTTNPDTGDNIHIVFWVVAEAISIGAIIFLVKKTKCKKVLSLVLCFAVAETIYGAVPEKVQATPNATKAVQINETIKVAGKTMKVTAIVNYDAFNEDNTNEVISREEWIVTLSQKLGIQAVTDSQYSFDDFAEASNPKMIEAAIRNRFVPIEADEDNMVYFKPDEVATREFVAYTTIHALKYVATEEEIPNWSDKADLTYPKEDKIAIDLEIFTLIDNKFMPNKELTVQEKEQAISVIERILDSANIETNTHGSVSYVEGVHETEMAYELNEAEGKVYVSEPEKIAGWQAGEVHVLMSPDDSEKDIAVKITDIKEENNQTVIYYEEPALEEVAESFDLEGVQATGGAMTPADGVTFEDVPAPRATISNTLPLFGKKKYSVNVGDFTAEGFIDLKEIEYRFVASPSWHLISIDEVYLAIDSATEVNFSYMAGGEADDFFPDFANDNPKKKRVKLADVNLPLPYGFNVSGEIYLIFNIKGGVEVTFEVDGTTGVQYNKGRGIRTINDMSPIVSSMNLKGEYKAGATFEPGAEFLGIDLVSIGADFGIAVDSESNLVKLQPLQWCLDANSYLFLSIFAQIGPDSLNLKIDKEIMNSDHSIWTDEAHFEETGEVEECTRGYGNYEGYVKQVNTSVPIHNAKVQILKGNRVVDTAYTDSNGKFVGRKLKKGSYKVHVSAAGYLPYERNFEIIGGDTTTLETQLMISRDNPNLGNDSYKVTGTGTITNAYTGGPVAGAKIEVRSKVLNGNGNLVAVVESNENGKFSFQAPVGIYEISVSKEGFVTNTKNVTMTENQENVNISLNPTNQPQITGNLRAVLHWGSAPRDLDSHMVGPQGNGRFHVYYSNKREENVNLDVDDTTSYGPETISINETEPGIYSYYIHNYSNRSSRNSTALSNSGAYIELYMGNTLLYNIHVPEDKEGTLWHVFDYNSETNLVTLVNEFSYESSPSSVGRNATYDARSFVEDELKDYEKEILKNNENTVEKELFTNNNVNIQNKESKNQEELEDIIKSNNSELEVSEESASNDTNDTIADISEESQEANSNEVDEVSDKSGDLSTTSTAIESSSNSVDSKTNQTIEIETIE